MPITVDVDPAFSGFNQSIIQKIINSVFEEEGYLADDVAIVFGDDSLLNKLKKDFFNLDQLTDVIAFRLNDYEDKSIEGEIYISIPRAKENAIEFSEPFAKEIGRLIIHGGLHQRHVSHRSDRTTSSQACRRFRYRSRFLRTDFSSIRVCGDNG
jgi:rRNA maturation RNase YbeY